MDSDTNFSGQRELPLITSSRTTGPLPSRSALTIFSAARMLVVQSSYVGLWVNIQHRFGPRMMEWFVSAYMLGWALVLLYVEGLFQRDSYHQFAVMFSDQAVLGWLMGLFAVARFAGLIVNGARPVVTPVIRQISAAGGFVIWCGISYAFFMSGLIDDRLATYSLTALAELVNFYRAAHDHGEAYGRLDK